MIPQTWFRQRQQSRGKEHRLIIRMRNEKTYPLVPQLWKPRSRNMHRVQPARDEDDGYQGHGKPLHGVTELLIPNRQCASWQMCMRLFGVSE